MGTFNQFQYADLLARENDPYANAKYEIILAVLKGRGPLRILNAGCGSGELSVLLAAAGHSVVGIDPEPKYVALANGALPVACKERCTFKVCSIEELPPRASFDVVIATDVLEHIEKDFAALEGLATQLFTGGRLVITVPAGQWLFGFHDEELGHFRRYRKNRLAALVEKTGTMQIERVRHFGWTLIPVCLLWSKLLRRQYPVAKAGKKGTISGTILKMLLRLDTALPLPFGTSLILFGRKR